MKTPLTLFIIFLFSSFVVHSSYAQQTGSSPETKGMASYYNDKFEDRPTASGEPYKMDSLTAAHRTLPFNTRVMVTNLENNKSVVVRVNDRGPFVTGRIIDVSKAAALELDFIDAGVTPVEIEVIREEE